MGKKEVDVNLKLVDWMFNKLRSEDLSAYIIAGMLKGFVALSVLYMVPSRGF